MEFDRPHFRTSSTCTTVASATTSELLICLSSSRLSSSSSMKLAKSIFSPGCAARDGGGGGPVSLSSSLSRRLRKNGSLRCGHGQASPFFTTSKKKGSGFENPEPSSPKVTCIGQVRVKTKKRVKQNRSLSRRRRSGEVSFRTVDKLQTDGGQPKIEEKSKHQRYCSNNNTTGAHYQQAPQQQECFSSERNHRWAHFSICEAFSCLFPCKSSCFSSEMGKCEKDNGDGCGAVIARWLVSYNEEESGKRRDIELMVGGRDDEAQEPEEKRRISMRRSSRRHVFEDFEVKDNRIEVKGQTCNTNEEASSARVSICIPPKNALLLMRCRSDPMKVAALANRFNNDENGKNIGGEENFSNNSNDSDAIEGKNEILAVTGGDFELNVESHEEILKIPVEVEACVMEVEEDEQINGDELLIRGEETSEKDGGGELSCEIFREDEDKQEVESSFQDLEENADEYYEDCQIQEKKDKLVKERICNLTPSTESEDKHNSHEIPLLPLEAPMKKLETETTDKENQVKPDPEKPLQVFEEGEKIPVNQELVMIDEKIKKEEEKPDPVLPDCLLLMMCEPKLSMEVSKETWVCRTDFLRCLPERPPKQPLSAKASKLGGDEPVKRRLSTDSKPPKCPVKNNVNDEQLHQPARSSCSGSMASMIQHKLVNAVAYEPFVLTRCKSEPMRTASAKLMPESLLWKNEFRKLEEPHRRSTVGICAPRVGI